MKKYKQLYSKRYKFIFYHIPKCALTAVRRALLEESPKKSYVDSNWCEISSIPSNSKVIAVLRDPYERFVSGFIEGFVKRAPGMMRACNHKKPTQIRGICNSFEQEIIKEILGCEEITVKIGKFLDYLESNEFFEDHIMPQYYWLTYNNKIDTKKFWCKREIEDIDYFLSLSSLEGDFSKVLGTKVNIPRQHPTDKSLKEEYNTHCMKYMDRILELYKEDVLLYREHIEQRGDSWPEAL